MDKNAWADTFTSSTTVNALIATVASTRGFFSALPLSTCRKTTVINCMTFSVFNTCTTCKTGFFLSSNTCTRFPFPQIDNCKNYNSLTTCAECNITFHLSSTTTCTANTVITNCSTYSATAATTTCTGCVANHYLNGASCTIRTHNIITSCQTYSTNADNCATCTSGFYLTNNGLFCWAVIANCEAYIAYDGSHTALRCATCAAGKYPGGNNRNQCLDGNILQCKTYTSSNICASCNTGYYLNSDKTACLQNSQIQNCQTYSGTDNKCETCNTGYFAFNINRTCINVPSPISQCQVYLNKTQCFKCNSGYYLKDDQISCVQIPTGCSEYSDKRGCTACTVTSNIVYGTTPNLSCIDVPTFVSGYCRSGLDTSSIIWTLPVEACQSCARNAVPVKIYNSEPICIQNSTFSLFMPILVSNCARYGLNYNSDHSLVCMECSDGFYLSVSNKNYRTVNNLSCVAAGDCDTSSGTKVIIRDSFLGYVNLCVTVGASSLIAAASTCVNHVLGNFTADDLNATYCMIPRQNYIVNYITPTVSGVAQYIFENLQSPGNPVSTTTDFYTSLSLRNEETDLVPTIFNYRGIGAVGAIASTSLQPNAPTADCEIMSIIPSIASSRLGGGAHGGAYTEITNSAPYYCLRCKAGFEPVFSENTASKLSPYATCQTSVNCASNDFQGGLPSFLNAALSCHTCSPNGQTPRFPTLKMETDFSADTAKGVFLQYFLPDNLNSAHRAFECAAAPGTTTVGAVVEGNGTVVLNCAVYGSFRPMIDASNTFPLSGNQHNFCLACATKYYPNYFATPNALITRSGSFIPSYAITSCTATANCHTSPNNSPFNSCGQCPSTTIDSGDLKAYAFSDHRFIGCYRSITDNCFILGKSIETNFYNINDCAVCNSGYILNLDGFCTRYTIPNIGNSETFSSSYFNRKYGMVDINDVADQLSMELRIQNYLNFNKLNYGASKCAAGHVLSTPVKVADTICLQSSYLVGLTDWSLSIFISHCISYFLVQSSVLKYDCAVCDTSYIPTFDKSACVAIIANCQYAQNAIKTKCHTCSDNFVNVNGVCESPNIAHCASLTNSKTSSYELSQSCDTCNPGFYLKSDGTCAQGKVQNCNEYKDGSDVICTLCMANYQLQNSNFGSTYCFPIPTSFNCDILHNSNFDIPGFVERTIRCIKCTSTTTPQYIETISNQVGLVPSQCLPYLTIAECQTYNTGSTLAQSTFYCSICNSGFFASDSGRSCTARMVTTGCATYQDNADRCLTCVANYYYTSGTGVCTARALTVTNCETVNPNADNCSKCTADYFLDSNGTACQQRTVKPAQCQIYNPSQDNCQQCNPGYFIYNNNECVPPPNGIANCNTYSSATTCIGCNAGYYLSSNACVATSTVTNCAIYSDANTCVACADNHFLASATSCVQITAPGCLTYASATSCASCSGGKSLGTTSPVLCVDSPVTNCQTYSSTQSNQCTKCDGNRYVTNTNTCADATAIANCDMYDSATTCSKCTGNNVLSADKTTCATTYVSSVDANCSDSFLNATPQCARCQYVFTSVNAVCTACPLRSSGCEICDSSDNKVCLICQRGYYMNQSLNCVSDGTTPVNPPSPPISVSASINACFMMIISLILNSRF